MFAGAIQGTSIIRINGKTCWSFLAGVETIFIASVVDFTAGIRRREPAGDPGLNGKLTAVLHRARIIAGPALTTRAIYTRCGSARNLTVTATITTYSWIGETRSTKAPMA